MRNASPRTLREKNKCVTRVLGARMETHNEKQSAGDTSNPENRARKENRVSLALLAPSWGLTGKGLTAWNNARVTRVAPKTTRETQNHSSPMLDANMARCNATQRAGDTRHPENRVRNQHIVALAFGSPTRGQTM
eukprot:8587696-Pyramimonas_sp.AAC.1